MITRTNSKTVVLEKVPGSQLSQLTSFEHPYLSGCARSLFKDVFPIADNLENILNAMK